MFGENKKHKEQIEALRLDVDGLRQEFAAFKDKMEDELETVRKDFREFLFLFEDASAPEEAMEAIRPGKEETMPSETRASESNEAHALDSASLQHPEPNRSLEQSGENRRIPAVDIQQLSEKLEALIKWAEHFAGETKSIRNDIREARKDIKSKISYSISRLRS